MNTPTLIAQKRRNQNGAPGVWRRNTERCALIPGLKIETRGSHIRFHRSWF
jgi:hypothetical protein